MKEGIGEEGSIRDLGKDRGQGVQKSSTKKKMKIRQITLTD